MISEKLFKVDDKTRNKNNNSKKKETKREPRNFPTKNLLSNCIFPVAVYLG